MSEGIKMPRLAWAIVARKTGRLVLLNERLPLFWNRTVARNHAAEHGLQTYAPGDYRIVRVKVADV